ncbi:hypothetical protein [Streptomyces canus]|uniref:hypothetical protein n=1 Tax=Streptomyces canus TaxID=58343 RepID=UPI00324E541C
MTFDETRRDSVGDLGRAAQSVQVAVGGGLDEGAVQGGEALQVLAGGVFFDAADVCASAGIEPAGQVLGEQRGEEHRREHEVGGDAAFRANRVAKTLRHHAEGAE